MKPSSSISAVWVLAVILGLTGASCIPPPTTDPRSLTATESEAAIKATMQAAYGKLPLHFEANQGQTDEQVLYENHFTVGVGGSGWRELFGAGLSPAGPGRAASADTLSWVVQGIDKGVYLNQGSITTSAAAAVSGGEEEDLLR